MTCSQLKAQNQKPMAFKSEICSMLVTKKSHVIFPKYQNKESLKKHHKQYTFFHFDLECVPSFNMIQWPSLITNSEACERLHCRISCGLQTLTAYRKTMSDRIMLFQDFGIFQVACSLAFRTLH